MKLETFSFSFVITKTPNLSNVKNKLAYLNQYEHRKKNQRIYGTTISMKYLWEKTIMAIIHIYESRDISYYFFDHKDTEYE